MTLTHEETETLCRVGPGTVMGDMMRQYWLPFLHDQRSALFTVAHILD